ncbi:hypothetical protein CORC01_07473 [Colletotrichum orchidophilum]|uniref:Zn(2)-C6 fungal-type domain-containing protein n=1 Tax=Colletotrichum orchidophilum TaxID=1209926 RepID=A0A1G4B6Z3_9PEZI|nr:uncharacterized protein CORC01_07473 [Colletotrichum orchidophilum]OHE97219.1 hypothetical protein CORC01_07473 [Colletotrichum orchidophilum]
MAGQTHRRSRNGCGTCRTARIKCDEARPFCKQCERRGIPYLAFIWKENSILLPAILAAGSSHLYALGKIRQAEVLERKQKALSTMVACVKQPRPILSGQGQNQTSFPVYLSEEAIAASSALVGMEIMQGSRTPSIVPLLRGIRAQIEERERARKRADTNWQIDKDTPMMAVNVKMIAYIDTLCCVPCAAHPVFDQQSWQDFILPKCPQDSLDSGPDIVFGYSRRILPLIGAAASLVDDFFRKTITPEAFVFSRYRLLDQLESACRDLPAAQHQPDAETDPSAPSTSIKIRDSNACIAAALAHSLATQIFLVRADEGDSSTVRAERPTKHPQALVEQLSGAVAAVPLDTHAATMMVWPVFVLGCESMAVSSRRHAVEALFERIIDKQKLLNISVALQLLRENMWKIGGVAARGSSPARSLSPAKEPYRYTQSEWVKMCWKERLQLCSA